jgi:hypothetical protein
MAPPSHVAERVSISSSAELVDPNANANDHRSIPAINSRDQKSTDIVGEIAGAYIQENVRE